uniref:Uncharacterized protein n=1 Tax=Rhizophora mucronata TaxID=61149 RepID=A0A2P2PX56_RHIMU
MRNLQLLGFCYPKDYKFLEEFPNQKITS